MPEGHDVVAPVALPHTVHDGPHADALLATQAPFAPHGFCPPGHWHDELVHCLPFVHPLAQFPQLALSFAKLTHDEPQGE
jgi:hypothetical protein